MKIENCKRSLEVTPVLHVVKMIRNVLQVHQYIWKSLVEKKNRHFTGDAPNRGEKINDESDLRVIMQLDGDSETDAPIHHLSVPLQPTEILQTASDLKVMMLPKIKMVVKETVSEATQFLKNDIKDLRDGITQLQNDNVPFRPKTHN